MIKRILIAVFAVLILVAAAAGFRYALAVIEVRREAHRTEVPPLNDVGATRSLEILPLYENAALDAGYQTGHGVSYLIRTDQTTLLMDLGMNETNTSPSALENNMQKLGITWNDINLIFISHNHPDHTGGVAWWQKGSFSPGLAQPDWTGKSVYVPVKLTYPGLSPQVAYQAQQIAPGMATLGVLPFKEVSFLVLLTPVNYEQTLAVNVQGQGIVLITGCGHPGLQAIVTLAEALFEQPVIGVVGGLHYGDRTAQDLADELAFLRQRDIRLLALSPHDSLPATIQVFQQAFPQAYQPIEVGRAIHFADSLSSQ
jgi:7,8-dihydropterin-6-yl-methyl-4-(beta-D-ribofuranosyl)aminobenzene 5'-phosphate synthase